MERRERSDDVSVFRFLFFRLFRGDPGDLPIWSEHLPAFRFVQVCSDLFRVVQGVIGVDGRAGGAGPAETREGSVGARRRVLLPSVIPAPPFRHSCAGRNPPLPNTPSRPPFPNSSLPPSRGEVRWGVERRERSDDVRCSGFFFSGCSGVIRKPLYLVGAFGSVQICSGLFGFVQGCSGRDPAWMATPGVRGRRRRGSAAQEPSDGGDWPCAPSVIPAPNPSPLRSPTVIPAQAGTGGRFPTRHPCALPSPLFLRPPSVIPAQAGTHPHPTSRPPSPIHPSPSQGGG